MSDVFDGETFGEEIVSAVKAFVERRCSALETKIARLEATIEAKNFAYMGTWKEGKVYAPGQFATYSGAILHGPDLAMFLGHLQLRPAAMVRTQ